MFAKLKTRIQELYSSPQPSNLKLKQLLLFGGVMAVASFVVGLVFLWSDSSRPLQEKSQSIERVAFVGAGKTLPSSEIWARRMKGKADKMVEENKNLKAKLGLVEKRLELMENAMQGGNQNTTKRPTIGVPPLQDNLPIAQSQTITRGKKLTNQPFAAQPKARNTEVVSSANDVVTKSAQDLPKGRGGSRLVLVEDKSKEQGLESEHKFVDHYIPVGTHVRATLLSAVVASTATSAASNPLPVLFRLRSNGKMPRGWRGCLKDAVVTGSCWGDISSERVHCLLDTLSYVEPSGEVVEVEAKGWVTGEDGQYGLRGIKVKRDDELLKQALIAGVLSGMANFFQANTTAGVGGVSLLPGQGKTLSPSAMLKGGAASGVGQALDRLAKYAIDEMEKISPVILINPKREVDIVFSKGVDLNKSIFRSTITQRRGGIRKVEAVKQGLAVAKRIRFKKLQQGGN